MGLGPSSGNNPPHDQRGEPKGGDAIPPQPSLAGSMPGYGREDDILKNASALIREGRPAEGIQQLRDGLNTFSESVKLHYGLGRKLIGQHVDSEGNVVQGVLEEAAASLEHSLRLLDGTENRAALANQRDPIDETKYPDTLEVNIRYHLGLAYLFQGRFHDGAQQLKLFAT